MPRVADDLADLAAPERIAKTIARAGLCSRREAEHWILAGRVAVNGKPIASPALVVTPADQVMVDGALLPEREHTRLWRYNKPPGLVTTHSDPQGRPTVFQRLPETLGRVISIGRLDLTSEGLLLLTNDGAVARRLELPSTGWTRRYRVRAHGTADEAALDRLRNGITLAGIRYGAIEARIEKVQGSNVWLSVALQEGKNREIRKVLEAMSLVVNRLIRVAYGPFQLGNLERGELSEISGKVLREQLGNSRSR
jgi:23S rRNA pseudouridine2605 synthase